MDSMWVHGNALVVESPEQLSGWTHRGWGSIATLPSGRQSWFHIPLPSPDARDDRRALLTTIHLQLQCTSGHIAQVVVYDGATVLPSSPVTDLQPATLTDVPIALDHPTGLVHGLGISLWFLADIGLDSNIGDAQLTVAGAGADYEFESILLEEIGRVGEAIKRDIAKLIK